MNTVLNSMNKGAASVMSFIRGAILVVITAALTIFTIQNLSPFEVRFAVWSLQAPGAVVQPAQVHRHHGPLAQPWIDPADDAGAAAEGDHRRALGLGPAQHRLDLRLVAGEGDQVRRVLELAAKAPDDIAVGFPNACETRS